MILKPCLQSSEQLVRAISLSWFEWLFSFTLGVFIHLLLMKKLKESFSKFCTPNVFSHWD